MAGRLDGKVAVVTGGCSGIGLATVNRFVEEGARVVIGDIDDQRGHELVGQLGGDEIAAYAHVDVTSKEEVDALFAKAKDTWGSVDIAFNNAGISPPDDDSILDTELEAWRRVQEVNLTSVYLCCKAALPYMLEQKSGSIINTASFVAVMGAATSQISYSASKGGVLSMSRELGVQFARDGHPGERAVPGTGEHARCSRSCSPRTPSVPPGGWCTCRWGGSPSPRRWPTRCCSSPPTSRASSPRARSWSTAASRAPT